MSTYREICVHIYPGKAQTLIAVTARVHNGARRSDRLLLRRAVDTVDAATVAAILRIAGDECHDAADRLI